MSEEDQINCDKKELTEKIMKEAEEYWQIAKTVRDERWRRNYEDVILFF